MMKRRLIVAAVALVALVAFVGFNLLIYAPSISNCGVCLLII
jgi:hypothetical protein